MAAAFSPDPYVTLTIRGKGRVEVAEGGSCAKARCALQFPYDERRTLRAVPAKGWHFLGWGGAYNGTRATCSITATVSSAATAAFAATPLRRR